MPEDGANLSLVVFLGELVILYTEREGDGVLVLDIRVDGSGGATICDIISCRNTASDFLWAVMKTSMYFGLRKVWKDTKINFIFDAWRRSATLCTAGFWRYMK